MSTCPECRTSNPTTANYCMNCGAHLPRQPSAGQRNYGINSLSLSLALSLLLSLLLMFVFKLPILFLAGFLPLFWFKRKRE